MNNRNMLLIIWLLLALCICAASAVLHMMIGMNNDMLLLMQHAGKMLNGGKAYVDFADVDPPLVYMLYTIPAALARLLPWPSYIALNSFDLLLCAGSLGVSAAIVRRSMLSRNAKLFLISVLGLMLLTLSFVHQLFADREHWAVVLVTPWLLLCAPVVRREDVSERWRIAAAAMAGIGFAIKPYAYVIYLMALVFRMLCRRPLAALLREREQHIIIGIALLYVVVVLLWFREYVTVILPVAADTYRALSWAWGFRVDVIKDVLLGHYALAALVLLPVLWRCAPEAFDRTMGYLCLLLVACIGSYALGGGWYYTQYPFMASSFVLAMVMGGRLIAACRKLGAALAASALLAALVWHSFGADIWMRLRTDMLVQQATGHPFDSARMPYAAWQRLEPDLESHPAFLWLSMNLWASNLVYDDSPWHSVGRFDYLWTLPGTLQIGMDPARKADFRRLSTYLADSIAEDIERHEPQMVVQDVSPTQWLLPPFFDVVDLLNRSPRFTAAWEQYALEDTIDTCDAAQQNNCAYRIYFRKGL